MDYQQKCASLGYPGGDTDLPSEEKLKHTLAFSVKERSCSVLPQPLSMSLLTYPSSKRILILSENQIGQH